MTDELEALLKEEQEEEEGIFRLLSAGSMGYAAYRKNGSERGLAAEKADGGRAVDVQAEEDAGPVGTVDEILPEEAVLSALRRDAAAVKAISVRTVSGKEGSAQALYRTLMRSRRAVSYQRPVGSSKTPLVRETVQTVSGNKDVLQLDRAFQRDARRYDGGFTWQ